MKSCESFNNCPVGISAGSGVPVVFSFDATEVMARRRDCARASPTDFDFSGLHVVRSGLD
jgi:hypothetical protein